MEKKTALYIRVSTEMQAQEGYSIQAQSEKLEAYAKLHDIAPWELYIDGGFSGSNLDRPEMKRLIEEAQAGQLCRVVVYKLDRLSRSQKDTLYLIEDVFLPNSIDFVSINENIDTGSPYGRAMIGILSAFAQLERENIHARTRMGMLERVKSGFWPGGGKIPYGYDYDPVQGILVPNEDAPKVQMMYEMYLKGESPQSIAKLFGLRYDKLVSQILFRRTNIGSIVFRGVEYQGQHAPIVSKETFERALQEKRRRSQYRESEGVHLLTGLCICGYCGSKMRYVRWGERGYRLMCYSQDKSKQVPLGLTPCENDRPWAEDVEGFIVEDLKRLSVDFTKEGGVGDLAEGERTLRHQETLLKNKLKSLYHLYAEQEDEMLYETIQECKGQLQKVQEHLEGIEEEAQLQKDRQELRRSIHQISETWDTLSPKQKQSLVRGCVEKVVIQGETVKAHYRI